ncbi:hypothetical protein BLX41_04995 [Pseudomonas protegens]|uniref:hypothetical protein n=1 Tax=Pseudomonas protegens TaxID=380021 RepID=UPI000F4D090E|nr:hypothetical protein [Pseudomonas protegens]ROL81504.1 hypothetical protein BLX41_04995 [Pseudomonas protegens]
MLFFLRDQALVRLLSDCQMRVINAQSRADLLEVLDRLEIFPGGLEFDHVQSITLLVLAFAALAAGLLMDGMGGMFWVFVALCFFSYRVSKGASGALTDLAASITRKCMMLGNDLSEFDSTADWRLKRLDNEFTDYQRGSESERRRIVDSLQGVYRGERHSLAFEYHHLRYVISSREREASGGFRTVYTNYHRYSLVVDFPWVREIAVRSSPLEIQLSGQPFKTDRDDFNQAFVLRGMDSALCERFAMPATLDLLMELSCQLHGVNLEFSSQGRLCLSFNNEDTMAYADPGLLSDLAVFRERIEAGIELPKLYPLLGLIERLAQQHDGHVVPATVPQASESGALIKEE